MQIFKLETPFKSSKSPIVYWTSEDDKSLERITRERKRDEYIERRNNAQSKKWRRQ